jgi:GxxExxY protein
MTEIIYKKESYAIMGACFEVYNEKGCGFLEPVYHECLAIEFERQGIPAISKPSLTLSYRGRILMQTYEPDFICFGKIVLELKTVSGLADEHRAQVLNYLHGPASTWGCWQISDITPSWNTSALQKFETHTQEPIFQMSLCNYSRLFALFAG